ncbi:hypothetical protein WR25_25327 [Diploscapter pachys]|uniref:Nose resistant-to-fluoxetine protein N-terminal domain-containing protein n=1 Tax=Diploscapter pachys TaxID=2018661 RepID=A0A2A2JHM5_9BILA|nr:hypothetical protein WR25_25327 [Diploscapter pachys]
MLYLVSSCLLLLVSASLCDDALLDEASNLRSRRELPLIEAFDTYYGIIYDMNLNADQKFDKMQKIPANLQEVMKKSTMTFYTKKANLVKMDKVFDYLRKEVFPKATPKGKQAWEIADLFYRQHPSKAMGIAKKVFEVKIKDVLTTRLGPLTKADEDSWKGITNKLNKIAAYFHEFDSFPLGIYNFIQNSTANISVECKEELQVVIQAFEDGKDNPDFKPYALPLFDASAKLGSGILKGHVNFLGSYRECKSISYYSNQYDRVFKGEYYL